LLNRLVTRLYRAMPTIMGPIVTRAGM